MGKPKKLSSTAATKRGWQLVTLPSGRRRVFDPKAKQWWMECTEAKAELLIQPKTTALPPICLRKQRHEPKAKTAIELAARRRRPRVPHPLAVKYAAND